MSRPLSPREAEALTWMIDHASPSATTPPVSATDREHWRAHVAGTRAGRPCGCGTCPSIELTDAAGVTPTDHTERVVLQADAPGALLLLFVDDDRLSYLELAPVDDNLFPVFPSPETFGAEASGSEA